mmetsp:Transcript_22549/g.57227  ORF Transcript_22549/g.57227 Transcript_22549/m.57227 type:complete len:220 (+) Transcript_22549:617-1276(+)
MPSLRSRPPTRSTPLRAPPPSPLPAAARSTRPRRRGACSGARRVHTAALLSSRRIARARSPARSRASLRPHCARPSRVTKAATAGPSSSCPPLPRVRRRGRSARSAPTSSRAGCSCSRRSDSGAASSRARRQSASSSPTGRGRRPNGCLSTWRSKRRSVSRRRRTGTYARSPPAHPFTNMNDRAPLSFFTHELRLVERGGRSVTVLLISDQRSCTDNVK